jgi:polar amino acid transport system ATP-binding protein/sulfate transport system ATP-binding protein
MAASAPYEIKGCLLKVDHVSVALGGLPILRDVNVEIRDIVRPGMKQGQVVALLAPSGMGKTTLFKALAGLDVPDQGQILLGEESVPVERGMVGVVAQNYPLFAHRTVLGNLAVAGRQSGLSGGHASEKAMDLLKRFGLADQARKYPVQLSGGQRQRVAIAQQFMCSEHFLLMDEPFSGLDLLAVEKLCKFITEEACSDELRTFIIVTHDIVAALEIADTVWIMGRDRDPDGNPVPGARIQKVYNLIELGLAWKENVAGTPEFITLVREIRELYPKL